MTKYYLRLEGVNMASFVYDTQHLSTIRGGGLLLLNAIDEVVNPALRRSRVRDLAKITTGASWGLLGFSAENDVEAALVAAELRNDLQRHSALRHATFVVDVLPAGDDRDYPKVRDQLHALNRWRQMQAPTLAIPASPPSVEDQGKVVCELDQVRPARGKAKPVKGESMRLSVSVRMRRIHGRDAKRGAFYKKLTGETLQFVRDFDELSADKTRKPLHHKIALIYLDGNGFGSLAAKLCTSEQKQSGFDQTLRAYQKDALKELLGQMKADAASLNGGRLRLETLLWGGDEIIWVVPAWKGWWMLGRFFELAAQWEIFGHPLTHAAGLVFCHHNAPIHRIKDLAHHLAELAKREDRSRNLVAYQVLESFDHAGTELETFRARRCPAGIHPNRLLVDGTKMLAVSAALRRLKHLLPKRQVYGIVDSLHDAAECATRVEQATRLLRDGSPHGDSTEPLDTLQQCFGPDDALWLHVLDLWDYVGTDESGELPTRGAQDAQG